MAGKEGLLAENGFFVPMNEHPSHLMVPGLLGETEEKMAIPF